MPLLFLRRSHRKKNRIDVRSNWPVQISDITLKQSYTVEPKRFPEIYLVTSGTVFHASPDGRQSLRPGSVIVAHAGSTHHFSQPAGATLVSLGFIPEWLAAHFALILRCPDLFSLIFIHCWLDYPSDQKIFVFPLSEGRLRRIDSDLATIRDEASENRPVSSLLEIAFMKFLLELAAEFGIFWRHKNRIQLRGEIVHALTAVESAIARGEPLRLKSLEPAAGISIDHLGRTFKKATGSTLVDYAQRRRAHHAAHLLLVEPDLKATAVARRLGFTDSAHLAKSFQKFFGHTPNSYRETFGSTPKPSKSP